MSNPYKCEKCGHQLAAVGCMCPCQTRYTEKDKKKIEKITRFISECKKVNIKIKKRMKGAV